MHDTHPINLGNLHDAGSAVEHGERRTRVVVAVALGMMAIELAAGHLTGSLALTADGWHMATHAGALGLNLLAYWFARTRLGDREFSFGTGKVHALGGYTSALLLGIIAILMIVEAVRRIATPVAIIYEDALPVAILGLVVNLGCAWLLHDGDHDHHHAGDDHAHEHDADHNLRAARLHVLADALTSILAIASLLAGWLLGWGFLDPVTGAAGGLVVLRWGIGLCRVSGRQLLDACPSPDLEARIRAQLESVDDVHVADLHLWQLGPGRRSCVASLVSATPREPSFYRELVRKVTDLSHVTVEVHRCSEGHAAIRASSSCPPTCA
jgi:cation diffusion facilitator family transporter